MGSLCGGEAKVLLTLLLSGFPPSLHTSWVDFVQNDGLLEVKVTGERMQFWKKLNFLPGHVQLP